MPLRSKRKSDSLKCTMSSLFELATMFFCRMKSEQKVFFFFFHYYKLKQTKCTCCNWKVQKKKKRDTENNYLIRNTGSMWLMKKLHSFFPRWFNNTLIIQQALHSLALPRMCEKPRNVYIAVPSFHTVNNEKPDIYFKMKETNSTFSNCFTQPAPPTFPIKQV